MKARHLVPVAVIIAAGLIAGCGDDSDTTTIKLIEHAETDVVRHLGPAREEDSAEMCSPSPIQSSTRPTARRSGPITGGTDEYTDASGQMVLHARDPEETEYDFTYEVEK